MNEATMDQAKATGEGWQLALPVDALLGVRFG